MKIVVHTILMSPAGCLHERLDVCILSVCNIDLIPNTKRDV